MEIINNHAHENIFKTKVSEGLIKFKWDQHGAVLHYIGAFFHFLYVLMYLIYVNEMYLNERYEYKEALLYTITVLHMYATFYDLRQMIVQGKDYFYEPWNYSDQLHIWFGYANIII